MRIFKVTYDSLTAFLFALDKKQAVGLLQKKDKNFFGNENELFFVWDNGAKSPVKIEEVPPNEGIFFIIGH
jgi:hypothetical protein